MALVVRTKRVTDPFNEKVRARIFGMSNSVSSGSEHDGDNDLLSVSSSSPSSLCLSHLVQAFLEDDDEDNAANGGERDDRSESSDEDSPSERSDLTPLIENLINPIAKRNADRFRFELLGHVNKAVEMFSLFRKNKPVFQRNVMAYLREIGYNAGVCKSKWSTTTGGGLTAGSYEFIDVVIQRETSSNPADQVKRYFVDVDFAGEFEIARETETYGRLRKALPRTFVGKGEELKRVVRVMCDEAKRSMKKNGLSLPPWRKNRYMQSKWFGPYRRTVNQLLGTTQATVIPRLPVKCRAVGFDAVEGGGGRFLVLPATRTR